VQEATGGYKETKFTGLVRESDCPYYRLYLKHNITLGEGRGNTLSCFEEVKDRRLHNVLETPERSGNFRGNYTGKPSRKGVPFLSSL